MHKLINIMLGILITCASMGAMYALEVTDELNTLADKLNALAKALTTQTFPQPKIKTQTSFKITNEKLWAKINKAYKFGKTNNQQYIGSDPYLYAAIYRAHPKTQENIEAAIISFLKPYREGIMQMEYLLDDDQLHLIEDIIAHPENIDELLKKHGLAIPTPTPKPLIQPEPKPQPEPKTQPKITTPAAPTGKITNEELWAKINKTHKFSTPARDRREIGRNVTLYEEIWNTNPKTRDNMEAAIMKVLVEYRKGILQVEYLLSDDQLKILNDMIADPDNWEKIFRENWG